MIGSLRSRPNVRMIAWTAALMLVLASTARAKEPAASATTGKSSAVSSNDANSQSLQIRIARLIGQLGDERYPVRQQAQEELSRLGPEAFDALSEAQTNDDIEIASRAKYLVQRIRIEWIRDTDSPLVKRILASYESRNDAGRMAALEQLAKLPGDVGLEPLCRLIRYEKAPLISKQGALLILGKTRAEMPEAARNARTKAIERALGSSNRPAAQWLRTDLQLSRDPEAALDEWNKLIENEMANLVNSTADTNNSIVLALERREVEALLKLKQQDRALEVMRKMIVLETDDTQSLSQLVDWLVKQKAWNLVDEVATKFHRTFNVEPQLLYALAQARQVQGSQNEAEELAKRAYSFNPQNAVEHLEIGRQLQERSLFDWSEREYRHVILSKRQDSEECIKAEARLSEMLHDQQRDLAAAKVLEKLVDAMKGDGVLAQKAQQIEQLMPPISRMHYLYACHYAAQNDTAEMWKHLDEALAQNVTDTEALILMYRVSADNPERHKRAQELVHDAADRLRNQINATTDDAYLSNLYNEFAWLICNTEGDLDLATRYSQKSLDLVRQLPADSGMSESGLLDTLAHCYAAKGDYETAVKHQTRAVEMEPYNLQIVRALDQFKAELEKHRQKQS